jgi:hypothetical protein
MEVEMVFETLGFYPQLTLLVAREYFIENMFCTMEEDALKITVPVILLIQVPFKY